MNLLYPLALTKIKGVGAVKARKLLSHFGSAEALFATPKAQLESIGSIGPQLAAAVYGSTILAEAEAELRYIAQQGIQILYYDMDDYPERLKNCFDAPLLLYYKGTANLNNRRIVSVVGTRNATEYGKRICSEFIHDLAAYDVLVTSGLAYGIDSYAHQAALTWGVPTVGVVGHGLDRIYPPGNRELAKKMLAHGGLLTEFPLGTHPERQHFPMRNRIIAGLADVTVVVEAKQKGGALITAELANSYNRDVCAFPGSIQQAASAGCNYLIKTNMAHLICNGKDLARLMNWTIASPQQMPPMPAIPLSDTEQTLYNIIQQLGQANLDTIASRFCCPQGELATVLLGLEIKGMIRMLPGRTYEVL